MTCSCEEDEARERAWRDARTPTPEEWDAIIPEGTPVRYWPLRPTSSVLPIETKTRSHAWHVSDHGSVLVDGISGSVALTHVDVLDPVLAAALAERVRQRPPPPPAPKVSRGKQRYERFLSVSDVMPMTFREFLTWEKERRHDPA